MIPVAGSRAVNLLTAGMDLGSIPAPLRCLQVIAAIDPARRRPSASSKSRIGALAPCASMSGLQLASSSSAIMGNTSGELMACSPSRSRC